MIKYFYSIYDSCNESYSDPMVFPTDATAKRAFALESMNPESMLHKFPIDFTLMLVGSFDSDSAEVTMMNKTICRGTDFVKNEVKE